MVYKIEFTCSIKGHHVYKTNGTPALNEKLNCKNGNCEEALSYGKHPIGVFRLIATLVGHMPIELSRSID